MATGRSNLVSFFLMIMSSVATSHATLVGQEYWSSVLPNTPIPKAVRDHLHPQLNPISVHRNQRTIPAIIHSNSRDVVVTDRDGNSFPATIYADAKQVMVDLEGKTGLWISYSNAKEVTVDHEEKMIPAIISPEAQNKKRSIAAASVDPSDHVEGSRNDRPMPTSFFLEKDLRVGAQLSFWPNRVLSGDYFLSRRVAESIPFSSGELSEILRRLSVQSNSALAAGMKETLRTCDLPAPVSEKKQCATSLESMVDFATSALGTRDAQVLSTTVRAERAARQVYTVTSWSPVPTAGKTTVACHAVAYAYTVFHCHVTPASEPYTAKLVGADGTKVVAAVMCHTNTSAWDPSYRPLLALKEKPGGATVCHLLQQGDLLWFAGGDGSTAAGAASA